MRTFTCQARAFWIFAWRVFECIAAVHELVSGRPFASQERDLQSALRSNIAQLGAGLKIIDGGKERITEAGRLDITAEDSQGNIVVIELKAGTALPNAVTQVLAYMGAIAESDQKPVRGILVAGEFHERVIWAARAVPNLELKKYSFQFDFESVK